jgi:spore germination cell wall hydrolase CwlJ-like protein
MTYPASAPPAPARAPFVVLATLLAAALALGPAVVWSQVADAAMKLFAPDKTARPMGAVGSTSVTPFHLQANAADRALAVRCLTDAIYYEAATEPEAGQRAVAQVVINRLRDPHFPKSVCGVVYQGWRLKTGCQFSFTCDGSVRRRPAPAALWNKLVPLAQQALDGYVEPEVGAATFYYATYVQP